MSHQIFHIGDLHLGHKKILAFSPMRGGSNVEEHDEWIIQQWNSVVRKNDTVYVHGDVAFSREGLEKVARLKGYKHLVRGNHDTYAAQDYLKYFANIYGLWKLNGLWLSHAPIHPQELRGKINVHGHVHDKTIQSPGAYGPNVPDTRYVNVSVENCNGVPVAQESFTLKIWSENG